LLAQGPAQGLFPWTPSDSDYRFASKISGYPDNNLTGPLENGPTTITAGHWSVGLGVRRSSDVGDTPDWGEVICVREFDVGQNVTRVSIHAVFKEPCSIVVDEQSSPPSMPQPSPSPSGAQQSVSTKFPTGTPDQSSWQLGDCGDWQWQVDDIVGLEPLTRISNLILIATFDGYGDATWNTPDGSRPTSEEFRNSSYDVTIIRGVQMTVDEDLRGTTAEAADIYVRGGTVGCDTIAYSDAQQLLFGSRYVFYGASWVGDPAGKPRLALIRAWVLDSANSARDEFGQEIALADIRTAAESIPYDPTHPYGRPQK
jgi:hypothetical protein